MYKKDLAINNLQRLICHKTKSNQTMLFVILFLFQRFINLFVDVLILLFFFLKIRPKSFTETNIAYNISIWLLAQPNLLISFPLSKCIR